MTNPRTIEFTRRAFRGAQAPLGLALLALPAHAQTQTWLQTIDTGGDEWVAAAAPDATGGVYVCGPTTGSLGAPNAGGSDAWLARRAASGATLWIRQLGTGADDRADALAPDGAGGVFVAGATAGALGGTSAGAEDAWLARYDADGTQLWIRQLGTSAEDEARALVPDGAGVLVSGSTWGSLAGPNAGASDGWLARYDAGGAQLWIRQFGTSSNDNVRAAASDGAGGVYLCGDKQMPTSSWPVTGPYQAWLTRFDGAGTELWSLTLGGVGYDDLSAAASDGSGGVFVGGRADASVGGPSLGGGDAWLARYDAAGSPLWMRQIGSSALDSMRALVPDGTGGLCAGGDTWGDLGGVNLGLADAWLARYSGAGTQLWICHAGTSSLEGTTALASGGIGFAFAAGSSGGFGSPLDGWLARYDLCSRATITPRNAGANPASFQASRPVLGSPFTATVDLATTGHALALLVALDGRIDVALPGGQRLLIADRYGHGLLYRGLQPGPLATFTFPVPLDPALCGFPLSMQARHLGGVVPFALSNAQDLVLGN